MCPLAEISFKMQPGHVVEHAKQIKLMFLNTED